MTEPVTPTALALTAGGVAVFGIVTGLHPHLLVAGAAGGLWALFYAEAQPLIRRMLGAVMSSLVAAWLSPAAAYGVTGLSFWPSSIPRDLIQFPVALLLGFLAMGVVGPGLLMFPRRKIEDAAK